MLTTLNGTSIGRKKQFEKIVNQSKAQSETAMSKQVTACVQYVNFEHVKSNFREERGLKKLQEKLLQHKLPSKRYLDYAWLQTNYYKEKPQG